MYSKTVETGVTWLVERDLAVYELTYKEGGVIAAPEGKQLTMTVNGIGTEILPGHYYGDIRLQVNDQYVMAPHGLRTSSGTVTPMNPALVIRDNRVVEQVSATSLIQGGGYDGNEANGFYLGTTKGEQNGIIVEGNSEYKIRDVQMDMEGFASCDFTGAGAGVTVIDDAKVEISHSDFNLTGVTRCAIHVGGKSEVTVNDCRIINMSEDSDKVDTFSWMIGFNGTNRLTQLTDQANVTYNRCAFKTNGWGICSIDGGSPVSMTMNDCDLELTGPRAHGYGAFCIGDNVVTMNRCHVKVHGYPMLVMGEERAGRPSVIDSVVEGRRFGAMVISDDNSVFAIHGSKFKTGSSTFCVKGSATVFDIKNSQLHAGNNVILQMMDTDETSMCTDNFYIPVGVKDEYREGRDLFQVNDHDDVIMNITDCRLVGDFFNSTSEIRAYKNGIQGDAGMFMYRNLGAVRMDGLGQDPETFRANSEHAAGGQGVDHKGAVNLGVNLVNSSVEGVVSSASQAYREGLHVITPENRAELSNVRQWATPTVNNGVVVTLDKTSAWTVTGTSYITGLTVSEGAILKAPVGKTLTMTVDGVETAIGAGCYQGHIVLTVD